MGEDKKLAAAVAAVNRYMELEASGREHPFFRERYGGPAFRMNIWGVSGRRDQMQVRTLMQLRTCFR